MKNHIRLVVFAAILTTGAGCGQQNQADSSPHHHEAPAANAMEAPKTDAIVETTAQYSPLAPQVHKHIGQLYEAYLSLKDALVKGDTVKAAEAARQLLLQDKNFDYSWFPAAQKASYDAIAKPLRPLVKSLAASTAIQQQRQYFEGISHQFYLMAKAFGGKPLYYEFCPMAFNDKGAYWMSASDSIANPYFGDEMLRCGKVVEMIR